jgi:hypothetical protein
MGSAASNPCRVCGQPIRSKQKGRTTCGHPRCKRANRSRPPASRAVPAYKRAGARPPDRRNEPDGMGRERIRTLMALAIANGHTEAEALVIVANAAGESVAVVMSVWRSR